MKSLSKAGFVAASVVVMSGGALATPADSLVTAWGGSITGNGDGPSGYRDMTIQQDGGIMMWSTRAEYSLYSLDGGVVVEGQPVRIAVDTTSTKGSFEVWDTNRFGTGFYPLFTIDTFANTGVFKGVNVSVAKNGTAGGDLAVEGALTVGGKAVVTQGSVNAAFGTSTATNTNSFAIGTSTASGVRSFAAVSGTASGISSIALGVGAVADTLGAVALGGAEAHGVNSVALGLGSQTVSGANNSAALSGGHALGTYSTGLSGGYSYGANSVAAAGSTTYGSKSFAAGEGTITGSYSATVLGSYNVDLQQNLTAWVGTDSLFTLGNGVQSSSRSNAQVTLKNGQTTLKNKYWVSGSPTADVTDPAASGGKALVVEGNTELKGKVIISAPQGDINPGIYGGS